MFLSGTLKNRGCRASNKINLYLLAEINLKFTSVVRYKGYLCYVYKKSAKTCRQMLVDRTFVRLLNLYTSKAAEECCCFDPLPKNNIFLVIPSRRWLCKFVNATTTTTTTTIQCSFQINSAAGSCFVAVLYVSNK